MTDGKTPASYEYNVDITRRVCEMSHPIGVSVEGELGCLGSLETGEAGEEDGIAAIHAQIPNTHLVMHGSSSVPQEWLAIIRQFRGDIKETYGASVEESIQSGVRQALVAAKNAARGIVKARFEAFGCAGQGGKIKPVALEVMARRYT
jgi:fructose-bisphosphate aldolase class II